MSSSRIRRLTTGSRQMANSARTRAGSRTTVLIRAGGRKGSVRFLAQLLAARNSSLP
jgi:hypothetical protein